MGLKGVDLFEVPSDPVDARELSIFAGRIPLGLGR